MISILLATRNAHKTREIQEILGNEFVVQDLQAFPEIPEVVESGKTFQENAVLKAVAVSSHCDGLVMADDSGLEVDSLGGAPGVLSARYAGEDATDERNIAKLQDELANHCREHRSARFRCVIALAQDGKVLGTFAGTVEGHVIDEPRGTTGFGYDPVFVPAGFEQTFGELPAETKNRISHRGRALARVREFLINKMRPSACR